MRTLSNRSFADFRNLFQSRNGLGRSRDMLTRAILETLESRTLLSTYTVSNTSDSGTGSLRQAITDANTAGGTNTVDLTGVSGTIALASVLPNLSSNLTIDGPGAGTLIVNGESHGTVFTVDSGTTAEINGLTITGGHNSYGGGVFNSGALTITDSIISGNSASTVGGGVDNYSTLSVTDSTISGNSAGTGGGGIWNTWDTVTVTNSTISGNTADEGGGGIYNAYGTVKVTDSTISGNSAPNGGGISVQYGTLDATNATLSENSSSSLGGAIFIFSDSATVNVTDSTISDNSADTGGGGMYNYHLGSSLDLEGTLVAANTNGDLTGTFTGTYNLVGDGTGMTGISNGTSGNQVGTSGSPIDPMLASLGNYGGPTQTMALLPGSPALNAGNVFNDCNSDPICTDQRSVTRPEDSTSNIGAIQGSYYTGGSSSPSGYSPSQIAHAYGFDGINFGGTTANGSGQTIAIVDAYNDTNISSDLSAFDAQFGLSNPTLTILNQTGGTTLPPSAPIAGPFGPGFETSLDVEWAHALAPGASILLIETNSEKYQDIFTGAHTAASHSGVSEVSISYGYQEGSDINSLGESNSNSDFTTPSGHQGVTFIAGAGDTVGVVYPAASPNVLGVGGTSLTLSSGNYSGEGVWHDAFGETGGGPSVYQSLPSYQSGVTVNGASLTKRSTPDVAFDAAPSTGVPIYDSYDTGGTNPWIEDGGTSLGAPSWAALMAITNQGRALANLPSLDGPSQTLPAIYSLPSSDFHDITSGSAAYNAYSGYDYDTGLGSPVANSLVPDLAGVMVIQSGVLQIKGTTGSDTISISKSGSTLTASVNGLTQTFSTSAFTSVSVNGEGGTDTLAIIGTSGTDSVSASTTAITLNSVTINYSAISTVSIDPGTGTDSLSVTSGDVTVPPSTSGILDRTFSTLSVSSGATLAFATTLLSDHSNPNRDVIIVSTLSVSSSGILDLGGNDMIVHSGNLGTITGLLASGETGSWTGDGIDSSTAHSRGGTAIGALSNSGGIFSSFDGVSAVTTDVILKYTYWGDANLSGYVDATDYTLIDNGFNAHLTGWYNGDFNLDGAINGDDFTLIDNAFNIEDGVSL